MKAASSSLRMRNVDTATFRLLLFRKKVHMVLDLST